MKWLWRWLDGQWRMTEALHLLREIEWGGAQGTCHFCGARRILDATRRRAAAHTVNCPLKAVLE